MGAARDRSAPSQRRRAAALRTWVILVDPGIEKLTRERREAGRVGRAEVVSKVALFPTPRVERAPYSAVIPGLELGLALLTSRATAEGH